MIRFLVFFLLLTTPLLAKLNIMTSVPVEAYFIQRIGGDRVKVSSLVNSAACPECFSMTPSQVQTLSKADLYFSTGFAFEDIILNKIAPNLPKLKVINLRQNIPLLTFGEEGIKNTEGSALSNNEDNSTVLHSHHVHHHPAGGKDPHIWTIPANVIIQAQAILEALKVADPESANYFQSNYEVFNTELAALDHYLKDQLQSVKGKSIFVYHPSYGYLAYQYGFKQVAIEIGGKPPTPKYLAYIIDRAKKENIKVIIIEPQSDPRSAKVIANAINGRVLSLNVIDANYFNNMRTIADTLHKYYQ
jgi:zinc transport system substrate-binding protein